MPTRVGRVPSRAGGGRPSVALEGGGTATNVGGEGDVGSDHQGPSDDPDIMAAVARGRAADRRG